MVILFMTYFSKYHTFDLFLFGHGIKGGNVPAAILLPELRGELRQSGIKYIIIEYFHVFRFGDSTFFSADTFS